jgi:flavin reductase (DIM6/NTAB) family NADH-FMN oxidoreductase RutF
MSNGIGRRDFIKKTAVASGAAAGAGMSFEEKALLAHQALAAAPDSEQKPVTGLVRRMEISMANHECFDLEVRGGKPLPPQFVRWVQPPQITYFVNSVDALGNHNVAPVTMGTTMVSKDRGKSCFFFPFAINSFGERGRKHSYTNLTETPECVVSYVGSALMEQSWIPALPIPEGISELEVADFTPLPSKKVKPCGIAECGINLELRIIGNQDLGDNDRMFMGKVVAVSVREDLLEQNARLERQTGMTAIDPLFEVLIDQSGPEQPPRLSYMKLDREHLYRHSEEIGSRRHWVGTFEDWMDSETERGRISTEEKAAVLAMWREWDKDKHPIRNADAKQRLTEALKNIVARPKDEWPGTQEQQSQPSNWPYARDGL